MDESVQLEDLLSEFARTMVTDFPIQAILDRLVARIVDVLPIMAAGVTLISPEGEARYVAASSASALVFEKLQSELGQGPCIEAFRSGVATLVPDLASDKRFGKFVARACTEGLAAVFSFPLRFSDGQLGALDLYRDAVGPLSAPVEAAAQTLADVTLSYLLNAQARAALFESNARFRDASLHDGLTGLPNRVLFLERLEHALMRDRRTGQMVAVFFADLDRFKVVNDVYGHKAGDQLLAAVAQRMTGLVRPGDTVGRLSGDEFVILCEGLDDLAAVEMIAERVALAFGPPFAVDGAEMGATVKASVGIAFASCDGYTPEHLLQVADAAMYRAKRSPSGGPEIVDLSQRPGTPTRPAAGADLAGALDRDEFRLLYQPMVAASTGRMVGVEALLRWAHPLRGTLNPELFLPMAERSGFITEVGAWVLRTACETRSGWLLQGGLGAGFGLSVNVSAHQLVAAGFVTEVAGILDQTVTDPAALTLEVTESAFIQDGDRAMLVLGDLKRLGVGLALDDFGTGYASLSHLHRFPIDVIKIDRTFVHDLTTKASSEAIVTAVIDLSHALGMTVTAEGVETNEQRRHLDALGCDYCQGYLYAHPLPAAALNRWADGHRPRH